MPARTHPGSLVDTVVVTVRAGSGGRGSPSFRHEPYTPMGGPDGGDGGDGGSVILFASSSVSSLAPFARRRRWTATDGMPGAGARKGGRKGEDRRLAVPLGTQVVEEESGVVLGDLDQEGAALVVAQGGAGGRGNMHFATAVNRSPRAVEPGRPGEERTVRLELKLIADVGLVGPPNAGKSSLLAALTAAQPKIGDYPFTTLDPQLGVLQQARCRLVLADIPGLIEGASRGAGLGLDFLRHIERTRVLLYLVDGSGEDPWGVLDQVRGEIRSYSPALAEQPNLVVVNKVDLPATRELAVRAGETVLFISAHTGEGLTELVAELARLLPVGPGPGPAPAPVIHLPKARITDREVRVTRHGSGFEISGPRIERLVELTDFDSDASLERFQVVLDRMGVNRSLEQAGVRAGDTVRVGDVEFEYQP